MMSFIGSKEDVAQFATIIQHYSRTLWQSITIINLDTFEAYCVLDVTSSLSAVILEDQARSYSLRRIDTLIPNIPVG